MSDPFHEALFDALDEAGQQYKEGMIDTDQFEATLAEYGFMIVPIEDPTNLRFGVDE